MSRLFARNLAVVALFAAVLALFLGYSPSSALGQERPLNPQYGPVEAQLGSIAQVQVPAGYLFLDSQDTQTLMQQFGNTVSGRELGTITKEDDNWFIVFEFDDIGYVKDDEKDQLDPDAILTSIKSGTERSNEYRREQGMPTMQIVGWQQPPTYNAKTHNLEWCVRATSEGRPVLNHNTRILGRSGVMQVTLVVDPERIDSVLDQATGIMAGFSYTSGQKYSQWTVGDKVAEYGLGALVVGGAAAVALKTGLLQKLIKPIIIGLVVVGGFVARFFRRIFFMREPAAAGKDD